MKFSALPVKVGDSFLLTTDDKTILVDGGMNKQHILTLLQKERIPANHIDLLVCTHYDADHINGIIGILESQKYSFKEIWLPEILGSIGYTLSKNIEKIFINLRESDMHYQESLESELSIFEQYPSKEIDGDSPDNNSLEKIDCSVLDKFASLNRYWLYELLDIGGYYDTPSYKIIFAAKSIANLVSYSLGSGAYVRWFKYQEASARKTYGFDMFSENAVQTDISIFDRELLMKALYAVSLSKINKYSLVYLHRKNGFPDILFTADSDLSFYSSQPVALKNGSIITSPHHGSDANNAAYTRIQGDELIYVRSDRSQLVRPGKGYTSNKVRYCTTCRNKTFKQKVEFDYDGTAFITKARACIC